jgi:hypothetical protein
MDTEIIEKIKDLKSKLTGNLFADCELHDEIYQLKKKLNPLIENSPELDDDECIACGS